MNTLKSEWNKSPQIYEPLQKASFTSCVGYGFKGEARARGFINIVNGLVINAGAMDVETLLDWDLRASPENWATWIEKGFGLPNLGSAIATSSLIFAKGNYRQMIGNPTLNKPFLDHFKLMGNI